LYPVNVLHAPPMKVRVADTRRLTHDELPCLL
jgi:hypothetical protein